MASIEGEPPALSVAQFNDSMIKSRYLNTARIPKLIIIDNANQRFFVEVFSVELILLLTFQSNNVDIRRRITCHPEANQKKA